MTRFLTFIALALCYLIARAGRTTSGLDEREPETGWGIG